MDLSIVVPTYNESKNIQILIPDLEAVLKKSKIKAEIIVVDDNSPDGTAEVAKNLNKKYKNIVVVVRKGVKGIASAWFCGYTIAKFKYVATIDADLAHSPEDLVRICSKLPEYDFVIGSRYMSGGGGMNQDKSFIPIFASKLAQIVTRSLIGLHFTDPTHSFRVFKREVFESVKNSVKSQGNYFQTEFLFYSVRKGFKVAEVPITYRKREHGKTKLNLWLEGPRFVLKAFVVFINTKIFGK